MTTQKDGAAGHQDKEVEEAAALTAPQDMAVGRASAPTTAESRASLSPPVPLTNNGTVALTVGAPASKQERETLAGGAACQQGSSPAGSAFREWPAVDADGWCEWQMPIMQGYLMQCCDCGLVHEVEFHVCEHEGRRRVEFRMRRAGVAQGGAGS